MGANGKLSTSEWKQKDSVGHQNLAKEYWVLTREFPNLLYTVNTLVAICLNNNWILLTAWKGNKGKYLALGHYKWT